MKARLSEQSEVTIKDLGIQKRLLDLVSGLKAVPGCLGVEPARTASGKNVIFAWFEDKKAVLRWYYSDMHQGAMRMLLADRIRDSAGEPAELLAVPLFGMIEPGRMF